MTLFGVIFWQGTSNFLFFLFTMHIIKIQFRDSEDIDRGEWPDLCCWSSGVYILLLYAHSLLQDKNSISKASHSISPNFIVCSLGSESFLVRQSIPLNLETPKTGCK